MKKKHLKASGCFSVIPFRHKTVRLLTKKKIFQLQVRFSAVLAVFPSPHKGEASRPAIFKA